MKSIKRVGCGLIASLLFTLGLHAAAERVDPLSKIFAHGGSDSVISGSPDSVSYCDVVENNK